MLWQSYLIASSIINRFNGDRRLLVDFLRRLLVDPRYFLFVMGCGRGDGAAAVGGPVAPAVDPVQAVGAALLHHLALIAQVVLVAVRLVGHEQLPVARFA